MTRTGWALSGAFLLGLWSGTVSAETWDAVHTSDTRTDWIDKDSLKMRHGIWSAWTRTRFVEVQRRAQDGVRFRSARTLTYFDCEGRRMGFETIVFYSDPNWSSVIGTVTSPDIKKLPMDAVPPGSPGINLLEAGCSRR